MKTVVRWVDINGREIINVLFPEDLVEQESLVEGGTVFLTEPELGPIAAKVAEVPHAVLSIERGTAKGEEVNVVTVQKKPSLQ